MSSRKKSAKDIPAESETSTPAAYSWKNLPGIDYDYEYDLIAERLNDYLVAGNHDDLAALLKGCVKETLLGFGYFVLGIHELNSHPWLAQRCMDVQVDHDYTLDLWFREGWKSTLLTYLLPLQEILTGPERAIAIFSHTRGLAKAFLRRIKHTLENSALLKTLFPDVLYLNPKSESPKWSEDDGLIVRRQTTRTESTLEAWGVVDGMPTGKHFDVRIYDDLVTRESCSTPDQMRKVAECFALSHNLGRRDGTARIIGTRYHFGDLYGGLLGSSGWKARVLPAEDEKGQSVFLRVDELERKRTDMGPYVYACQMLLNPIAEGEQVFSPDWLQFYTVMPTCRLVKYILVDPASSKKRGSDYTVMVVLGVGPGRELYLLDMVRDKLNLSQRWLALRGLVLRWGEVAQVGYEKYGMMADIEYFNEKMDEDGPFFTLRELGGQLAKADRIKRLVPLFASGRFTLPRSLTREDWEGRQHDLVQDFVHQEYLTFPFSVHDDMLDAISRIRDDAVWPEGSGEDALQLAGAGMYYDHDHELVTGEVFKEASEDEAWMNL